MSTPTLEELEGTQRYVAACHEAERALEAALKGLTESAELFSKVKDPRNEGLATFNCGRVSTLLDMIRPMASEYKKQRALFDRVAAHMLEERAAHLELYGRLSR